MNVKNFPPQNKKISNIKNSWTHFTAQFKVPLLTWFCQKTRELSWKFFYHLKTWQKNFFMLTLLSSSTTKAEHLLIVKGNFLLVPHNFSSIHFFPSQRAFESLLFGKGLLCAIIFNSQCLLFHKLSSQSVRLSLSRLWVWCLLKILVWTSHSSCLMNIFQEHSLWSAHFYHCMLDGNFLLTREWISEWGRN